MLIIKPYETLVLPKTRRLEWREPSARRTLDGIENRTWFSLNAFTSDGVRFWRGWFEDYDDADAFMIALARHKCSGDIMPASIRRLPVASTYPHTFVVQSWWPARYEGEWRPEFKELPLSYQFLTQEFLTSPTGSNQTWNRPANFDQASSLFAAIGGGASGSSGFQTGNCNCTGGGGGSYGAITAFAAGATETYQIATGGAAVSRTAGSNGITAGNGGGDTWIGDTAFATADVGGEGGTAGGGAASNTTTTASAGGTTGGPGTTEFAGGASGRKTASATGRSATGGGGGAGPSGAGGQGVDVATSIASAGGTANNGTTAGGAVGAAGNNGSEWTSAGSGSASGGQVGTNATSLAGGLYGGASGSSCSNSGNANTGAGGQGIVYIEFTPQGGGIMFKSLRAYQHMLIR